MNRNGISFLTGFSQADQEWLLHNSLHRLLSSGERLLNEGAPSDALYIVLYGLLRVEVETHEGPKVINRLGPGELIGEISFIENSTPSASVVASERSAVLEIGWDRLDARIEEGGRFAVDLYRSFGETMAGRLRRLSYKAGWMQQFINETLFSDRPPELGCGTSQWQELDKHISGFLNDLYRSVEEAIFADHGDEMAVLLPENMERMDQLVRLTEHLLGQESPVPFLREELGLSLQHRFSLHLQLTDNGHRWLTKPRGFNGDYLTIAQIQQQAYGGKEPLGVALDRYLLQLPLPRALRYRLELFTRAFEEWLAAQPGSGPLKVTILCCNANGELVEALKQLNSSRELLLTLSDIDPEAINYGSQRLREECEFHGTLETAQLDLVRLAMGEEPNLPPEQDLIINMNLLAHFEDDIFRRVLDQVHGLLVPGGQLLLGGLASPHYAEAFMLHVFDWRIHFRSPDELAALIAQSRFGHIVEPLRQDPEQLGYIARCQRRD